MSCGKAKKEKKMRERDEKDSANVLKNKVTLLCDISENRWCAMLLAR